MKLEDFPVVTIEGIVRFRDAALKVQKDRDDLLQALATANMFLNEPRSEQSAEAVNEFSRLIHRIRKE
jgi:hypothetical protein